MIGFIYKWTNLLNSKMYIGSHKGTIDDGYVGSGKIFNRAIKKYGIENFEREILEEVTENLYAREQHYLDETDAANNKMYYNIASQAGGGWDHINNNLELKQRCNEESSRRIKQWIIDNGHPKGMKGKTHTEESNAKRRVTNKRWTQENIEVSVYQFTFNGKLKQKHNSITDAANSVNGSPSNIKYTCDGKFNNAYGYLWSYNEVVTAIDIKTTLGKKKVQTPAGIFNTVTEAVRHHNFTSTVQVRRRCLSDKEKYKEWKYISEE